MKQPPNATELGAKEGKRWRAKQATVTATDGVRASVDAGRCFWRKVDQKQLPVSDIVPFVQSFLNEAMQP